MSVEAPGGGGSTLDDGTVGRILRDVARETELPAPRHPDYEIGDRIGEGGMGTVHRAFDRKLQRPVAMKVLRLPATAFSERFQLEAVSTAALQHPAIAPVFDYGRLEDGRPFYTMRLVEGRDLGERIGELHRGGAHEGLPELLRLFADALEGVAFAHDRGIVHGDLKPRNLRVDEAGAVFVLDWGLARRRGERRAAGDPALGTFPYVAPEQAAGRGEVGPAADVFAAGVVLWEILAGRVPKREGPELSLDAGGGASIPAPLFAVARKATRTAPEDRYPTAREVARDLRRHLAGEPVSCHRDDWSWRVLRFLRRYRLAAAAIGGYLLMRIVVLIVLGR